MCLYMYFQSKLTCIGLVTISGSGVSTLTDYSAFSTEIVSATPTGTDRSSYTITNTALQACPTVDSTWQANSILPPSPDADFCSCMVASLSCVVSSSVDSSDYGDLFDYFYGLNDDSYISGILANGTSGEYGAFSMCSDEDQLSWAMNAYYQVQSAKGNGASACDFSGSATTQSATTSSGSCSSKLAAVGTAATGSTSGSAATATGSNGASGSGSSSGNAGFHAAAPTAVFVGSWQLGAYIVVAFLSGGAMLVL